MFLGQAQVIKQREAEADHPDNPYVERYSRAVPMTHLYPGVICNGNGPHTL